MTSDTDYELVLYRKGTAGTITMTADDGSYVISGSRSISKNENEISKVEFKLSNGSVVPAENFLSSSCAKWSGGVIGALRLGDMVRYSVYPSKTPTTKTQVFYGLITELQQSSDGALAVKAEDFLKALQREYMKIIYSGYRDSLGKTATWGDGVVVLSGMGDSNMVMPMAEVSLALNDARISIGDPASFDGGSSICGGSAAKQAFFPNGNAIVGVYQQFDSNLSGIGKTVTCQLHSDDGSGGLGALLATGTGPMPDVTTNRWASFALTSSGVPVKVIPGNKYWIHWTSVGDTIDQMKVEYHPGSYLITSHMRFDGTNWSTVTGEVLNCSIDEVTYNTYDEKSYVLVGTDLYIQNGEGAPAATQSYMTIARGLVSYYYGQISNRTIADRIVALRTGLTSVSSSNQNLMSGTFSTAGKKLLEALQELADQYMTSGSWSGYQLALAHYESGGSQYLKWGKRLTMADPSYVTFSHGEDSTSDDEVRIVDHSGLQMRTDMRPPRVMVVGKDPAGKPLVYTVTDRALTNSFEAAMEGFTNVQKIVDDNLVVLSDVQARGDAAIMAYNFNVWEGDLIVSGVYPELIDLDTSSASFGSGKIITVNLSPVGIVAQKFKVLGVKVEANQTTITVSNKDLAVLNAQKYINLKANRTEAFYAPVGLADNAYIAVYDGTVNNGSTYWMELQDGSGNPIAGSRRLLCTKHSIGPLNLNVYHAEFESDNGHATPPGGVRYIALYAAVTGGAPAASCDMYAVGPPYVDERFDKFKGTRLIVDYMTKNS